MVKQQHVNIDIFAVAYTIDFIHEIAVSDCLVLIVSRVACVVLVFGELCRGKIGKHGTHFVPYVAIAENYIGIIVYKRIEWAQCRHYFPYESHKVPSPS